jgi:hypothetical protein
MYGTVFKVEKPPFTMKQTIKRGNDFYQRYWLRSILISHYGARVMHNDVGALKKMLRVTPDLLKNPKYNNIKNAGR